MSPYLETPLTAVGTDEPHASSRLGQKRERSERVQYEYNKPRHCQHICFLRKGSTWIRLQVERATAWRSPAIACATVYVPRPGKEALSTIR